MHTFFINTSGMALDHYKEILEMQQETRKLVSLECPIDTWLDEEAGFKSCARRMGELIDSYKEINNDYNLIVYVDLIAYKPYTSLPFDKHQERYACVQALYALLTRYIRETLVRELYECGRDPQGVVIVFEENRRPQDGEGEYSEYFKQMQRAAVTSLMGLPSAEVMNETAKAHLAQYGTENVPAFAQRLCAAGCSELHKGLLSCYDDLWDTFLREMAASETAERPMQEFTDRVMEQYGKDGMEAHTVSFVTNRRAGAVNKQECAKRDLRLYFYLLDCVENNAVICPVSGDASGRDCRPTPFPSMDGKWEYVFAALKAKADVFRKKHRETVALKERFSDLKLAPELYEFDHERFGMDEFGVKNRELFVRDAEPEKDDTPRGTDGPVPLDTKKKEVVAEDKQAGQLFPREQFRPFNYFAENAGDEKFWNFRTEPEEFIRKATEVREHHLNYLKKLGVHVSEILSNYAGRSVENEPALLTKRRVSLAEEDFEDDGRGYRYRKGAAKETRTLKTVSGVANEAYTTVQREYLKFCAGRTVAVTDIEDQCNWFVTRIHQIADSLKKIAKIVLGLLIAIVVLYIPFVVIQWEAITENLATLLTAIGSFAVPLVLLYAVLLIVSIRQRKQYVLAWEKFKKKSDEVLRENGEAAQMYDRLLSVFVPSLRWVYEYKIDVEFYEDCCRTARAKIDHHEQKMHDRVVLLENICEDLELDEDAVLPQVADPLQTEVDYNVSFCSGKQNRAFYAVVERSLLDYLRK